MKTLRNYLGFVWVALGPLAFAFLLSAAYKNINSATKGDIANPVPWIIVILVFTPIVLGLMVFGWYCWKGEYNETNS